MKRFLFLFLLILLDSLIPQFSQAESVSSHKAVQKNNLQLQPGKVAAKKEIEKKTSELTKDKNLNALARYFEKADAIHREAWWVLANERRPIGKSPFGKIQRALLSSQNIKLANKSMFRCDRYIVKRDIMSVLGFPQRADIFEKCSAKLAAKKIAEFFAKNSTDIQVVFFPENLEELLGLGATVINKPIICNLKGNEYEQLVSLNCQNWSQERSKDHMIRLEVYEYEMKGRNLIKLRGKVYDNLSESRKIEADVPMHGKIFVTETELYPPEEIPEIKPVQTPPAAAPKGPPKSTITPLPALPQNGAPIPPPRGMDPDVMMQQRQQVQPPMQQWNPNGDIPTLQVPQQSIQPIPHRGPPPIQQQDQQNPQQQQLQQQQQQQMQEQQQPQEQQMQQQQLENNGEEQPPNEGPQQEVDPGLAPANGMQPLENGGQENQNLQNPTPVNQIPAGGVYGR
ncbi:MAG: hypothetical protein ACXVCP_04065 [Bdellovibrio sp.]